VQNAGEHTPVSQSNAHGFAEIGFKLLIGHTFVIALGPPEVAPTHLQQEPFPCTVELACVR
jgi:hypothetical protein